MPAAFADSGGDDLAADVLAGRRTALARAITLVESRRSDHRAKARMLMQTLAPHTGRAMRIGVTGVPGVGKSTLIEHLGLMLTARGHRVAVLAVDPSSTRTGGSILGDKTRMAGLAADPAAYIRPSPAGGTLGGVAARTGEVMLICEAAGFDVVLVETVGVGQSETAVADLVDLFAVLMLAGAGDELQGIKKGVIELADLIAVNKADGDNADRARLAAADLRLALGLIRAPGEAEVPVTVVSGATGAHLPELWELIAAQHAARRSDGRLQARRSAQQVQQLRGMVLERLLQRLTADRAGRERMQTLEADVARGALTPLAAMELAETWLTP